MTHDIFISYSNKDKAVADAVVSALENEKIRCWIAPRDINPGADWGDSITEAIHACKIVLLIFSSSANQSKRVLDEIYYAISEEKTILPFRIENLDPTDAMRLHLSSQHWLDAYQPSWQEYLDRLVESAAANLWRVSSKSSQAGKAAQPEKAKKPWFWIGVSIVLLVILGVVSVMWFKSRNGVAVPQPTAVAEKISTATLAVIPLEEKATPTETLSPTHTEQPAPTETPVVIEQEVVLNGYFIGSDYSLDPQIWFNRTSLHFHENLFLSLTNYDIGQRQVIPEAAVSWTISPDGKLYTFKLRTDIPWVIHIPGGETVQATDEDGKPLFVTAQDFIYAFQRVCDPRIITSGLEYPLIGLLKGCEEARMYEDPENIPQKLLEGIGVKAIGEDELLIELEQPGGYFLPFTTSYTLSAMPGWAIDKYGTAWTSPGNIPTNGRFVIDAWVPGESVRWIRNPLLPVDLEGKGNIDIINFVLLEDEEAAYALWLENRLDYSPIPSDELLSHRASYANETTQVFEQLVDLIMFGGMSRPPFDNVHLRRAFAASFDRETFINDALEGQGIAMRHLAPPDVFGSPPVDEVGVGYDVKYARAELAVAGYPDCQGMPEVRLILAPSKRNLELEGVIRKWEENLNCPAGTIQITLDGSSGFEMLFAGKLGDYPDEHEWVGRAPSCKGEMVDVRDCNEIDDLIEQAAREVLSSKRIELYAQIEEAFFGEEGEFPLIPVRWAATFFAEHTWLERTQPMISRELFYDWVLNMDAKLAAEEQE